MNKQFKRDAKMIVWFLLRGATSFFWAFVCVMTWMIYNMRVYDFQPSYTQIYWGAIAIVCLTIFFFCAGPRLTQGMLLGALTVFVLLITVRFVYKENTFSNVEFVWAMFIFIAITAIVYVFQKDRYV